MVSIHSLTQHNGIQNSTAWHSTAQHGAASAAQHSTAQRSNLLETIFGYLWCWQQQHDQLKGPFLC